METASSIAYVTAEPALAWPDIDDVGADAFAPTLPNKFFPVLLAGAKSKAFLELKQDTNPKAEQFFVRTLRRFREEESVLQQYADFEATPNYGRK